MYRVFNDGIRRIEIDFDSREVEIIFRDKVVRRSFKEIPNVVLRPETEEYYGLVFINGWPYIVTNGIRFELVKTYYVADYEHDWKQESRPINHAGIEVETQDGFTTNILVSILEGAGVRYELTADGTANAEVKMSLIDWAKILAYIKPTMRFESTHVHFSNSSCYETFEWLVKHVDDINPKIFGRRFRESYAYYSKHPVKAKDSRYAWVTFPDWGVLPGGDIFVDVEYDDERVTVEFRLPCITNLAQLRNVLLVFRRNVNILQKVSPAGKVGFHQVKRLFEEIDRIDKDKEVIIGRYELRDFAMRVLEKMDTPESRAFWVIKPYLEYPENVACDIVINTCVEWR